MARIVADVYVDGGRNIRVLTTPGRSVQFTGGHAFVVDDRDMPHILQMAGARVFPRPESMPWASEWLSKVDHIVAEVNWPEGWRVRHRNRQAFGVRGPDDVQAPTAVATVSEPVTTIDVTARPWINPEDLLGEPEPSKPERPKRVRAKAK